MKIETFHDTFERHIVDGKTVTIYSRAKDSCNEFLKNNNVNVIDIKYQCDYNTYLKGYNDSILLLYEEKQTKHINHDISGNNVLGFIEESCYYDRNLNIKNSLSMRDFKIYYEKWCRENELLKMRLFKTDIEKYLKVKYDTSIRKSGDSYHIMYFKLKDDFLNEYRTFSDN